MMTAKRRRRKRIRRCIGKISDCRSAVVGVERISLNKVIPFLHLNAQRRKEENSLDRCCCSCFKDYVDLSSVSQKVYEY